MPSPPHPNPLPRGEREPEVPSTKGVIANSTVLGLSRGGLSHSSSSTTTDFAGNMAVNPSSVSGVNSRNSPGLIVSGASNVLWACISPAVSTRPEIGFARLPWSWQWISAETSGLRLQSVTWILPALSREAEALARGSAAGPGGNPHK